MTHSRFQPGAQHPDEYRIDLNPEAQAGQNTGLDGPHPEKAGGVRTAYDIKNLHNRLQGLDDTELKAIVVLPTGTRLEQGATYIDLRDPEPREFTARGDQAAGPEDWYVPKSEIDYVLWNRLTGVHTPARLDEPDNA